ncbi:MAG: ABC transporter ATP-binding protein [Spirochaetaceae bacterium]
MIEVGEVTKRYGAVEAVRGVSFEVEPKEIVGLLGPNGAGKTTLMRILTCYHFPTAGRVMINNHDVYTDPIRIKESIGYLPESSPVYGELTVSEYLQFVADARSIPREEQVDRIASTLQTCGLTSVLHRPIEQLSKGFKQRVGLAQAILHDPEILILDEPTTGLDPNQIAEIRRLIRRLGTEKTVILSTHILQEVEAVCDRVMILNEGRIVATGTTEEIAAGMKGDEIYPIAFRRPAGAGRRPDAGSGAGNADAAPESADPKSIEASLKKIPGLDQVQELRQDAVDPLVWRARLFFAPGQGAAPGTADSYANAGAVFDWALREKVTLLELRREAFSLEDVFATLTTGGSHV